MKEPKRRTTVSTLAIDDVKRIEKSINALNTWYILVLYLLLLLSSGLAIWTAYSRGIFAPYTYMYVISFITLIAGVTFRYFAITKLGSFIIGAFSAAYMLAWVWMLFDQATNGVMTGSSPKTLIYPREFYASSGLLAVAALLFIFQPLVQSRRKRLVHSVKKQIKPHDTP